MKRKTDQHNVLTYAHSFDLIWICEVKTGLTISVPGFVSYHNIDKKNSHRGGIVLLMKHWLVPRIIHVDLTEGGQIWAHLSCCQNLALGGCYVPPSDSDYHDPALLGSIQARLDMDDGKLPILLGDLNARIWSRESLNSLWLQNEGTYETLADQSMSKGE